MAGDALLGFGSGHLNRCAVDAMKPYYDEDGITIYHGNALEVLPHLEAFDAIVTDPPYSSGGQFRSDRIRGTFEKYVHADFAYRPEFSGDNRDQRGFLAWATLWLSAAMSRAKSGAHVLMFTDWRQLPTCTDAIQAGGWIWRGISTWHKPGIRMQRGGFSQSAEYVVWGTAGPWNREHDYSPQNVMRFAPVASADKDHIAEKPLEVLKWLVQFSPVNGSVVDPFCGSGPTLEAAKQLGRKAIGIEIEEKYCEIAVKRLAQSVLPLSRESEG